MKPFEAQYQWDEMDERVDVIVLGFASSLDVAVIMPGGQMRTVPIGAVRASQDQFPDLGTFEFWWSKRKVPA